MPIDIASIRHAFSESQNVPADVCHQCGEAPLSDSVASSVKRVVQEARSGQREFEVLNLTAKAT